MKGESPQPTTFTNAATLASIGYPAHPPNE
jgi:hypothetical protein